MEQGQLRGSALPSYRICVFDETVAADGVRLFSYESIFVMGRFSALEGPQALRSKQWSHPAP